MLSPKIIQPKKKLVQLDWNDLSELGLQEKINREILHPLGLALCRTPDTGYSKLILVADDGFWEYEEDMETTILPEKEFKEKLAKLIKEKKNA